MSMELLDIFALGTSQWAHSAIPRSDLLVAHAGAKMLPKWGAAVLR